MHTMPSAILAQLVVLLVISVIIRVSVMGVDQSFTGNCPLSLDGRNKAIIKPKNMNFPMSALVVRISRFPVLCLALMA